LTFGSANLQLEVLRAAGQLSAERPLERPVEITVTGAGPVSAVRNIMQAQAHRSTPAPLRNSVQRDGVYGSIPQAEPELPKQQWEYATAP
jgi:hypothetical protein